MSQRLACHITVAAVVEREGRFLFVEERANGHRVLNQPAGHLEAGENAIDAVIREVLEETGLVFEPCGWLGELSLDLPGGAVSQRIAFVGHAREPDVPQSLDPAVIAVHWLTPEAARDFAAFRSPLVEASIDWYREGPVLPLARLAHYRLDGTPRTSMLSAAPPATRDAAGVPPGPPPGPPPGDDTAGGAGNGGANPSESA